MSSFFCAALTIAWALTAEGLQLAGGAAMAGSHGCSRAHGPRPRIPPMRTKAWQFLSVAAQRRTSFFAQRNAFLAEFPCSVHACASSFIEHGIAWPKENFALQLLWTVLSDWWMLLLLLLSLSLWFLPLHFGLLRICWWSVQYKRSHLIGLRVFFVTKAGACRHFSPLCSANGPLAPVTKLRKRRNCCHCLGVKTLEFREICLDGCDRRSRFVKSVWWSEFPSLTVWSVCVGVGRLGAKGRFRLRKKHEQQSVPNILSDVCRFCGDESVWFLSVDVFSWCK